MPLGAALVVVTVTVRVTAAAPLSAAEDGDTLQVVPAGAPLHARLTVPEKLLMGVSVSVYVVLLPAFTFCDEGDDVIEKSRTF